MLHDTHQDITLERKEDNVTQVLVPTMVVPKFHFTGRLS